MKQQDKPTYNGLTFDSSGEMHFYWWCEDLINVGFIKSVEPQPAGFILSESKNIKYGKEMKKVENKILDYSILKGHSYTPDFIIHWDLSSEAVFSTFLMDKIYSSKEKFNNRLKSHINNETSKSIIDRDTYSYIEVKPSFDQNNMTRLAVLNQKWVMDKFGVFINIVIPEKLFQKTFTPKRYFTCDKSSAKRKIKYSNIITLEDFLLSS